MIVDDSIQREVDFLTAVEILEVSVHGQIRILNSVLLNHLAEPRVKLALFTLPRKPLQNLEFLLNNCLLNVLECVVVISNGSEEAVNFDSVLGVLPALILDLEEFWLTYGRWKCA